MIHRTLLPEARARRGLTLIEILVVLGILGVLAALTVTVVLPLFGTSYEQNTRVLLQKVDKALQQRWTEVLKKADQTTVPDYVLKSMAGGDAYRARVIWKKLLLKQYFPVSYKEAVYPAELYPTGQDTSLASSLPSLYRTRMQQAGINVAGINVNDPTPPGPEQASACLLMALTRGDKGQRFDPEEAFGAGSLRQPSTGLPYIVDGWGEPIAFFRWTTSDNPEVYAEASRRGVSGQKLDPEDPQGTLLNPSWALSTMPNYRQLFEGVCHPSFDPNQSNLSSNPPRLVAYFTIPTLVSAGADQKMGLELKQYMKLQANRDAEDNIYSFTLR